MTTTTKIISAVRIINYFSFYFFSYSCFIFYSANKAEARGRKIKCEIHTAGNDS